MSLSGCSIPTLREDLVRFFGGLHIPRDIRAAAKGLGEHLTHRLLEAIGPDDDHQPEVARVLGPDLPEPLDHPAPTCWQLRRFAVIADQVDPVFYCADHLERFEVALIELLPRPAAF